MTIPRALLTIVSSSLLFSCIGGIAGFLIGKVLPGYYRAVFSSGDSPDFDPVQVGSGLGITQGLTAGIITGLILVVLNDSDKASRLRVGVARFKQFAYKRRHPLIVCFVILTSLVIFIDYQLRQLGQTLAVHTYTNYVANNYMPAQRRLTRAWPKSLNGLEAFIKRDVEYIPTERGGYLNTILKRHRTDFQRLEPVAVSDKSYTYILHLSNRRVGCESHLDGSGYCRPVP